MDKDTYGSWDVLDSKKVEKKSWKKNFHKSELTNHINLQPDFIITIIDGGKMSCYLCFDQITKNIYMVIHISINHWLIDIWITKTHIYVGGKREEEKLSMLPEDIDNFSP